jgi:hypothetical protein
MIQLSKMTFNSPSKFQQSHIQTQQQVFNQNMTSNLRTPMIGRVYNAKPGCSACGKKVA